ncbi:hypothetical protein FRB95_007221 [Tulasnella sp. JGI-2019a]|nr:hypothetical protein FRB93_013665 [Tulasnella sp. JGI-2019a]KAG9039794.1 hypothetical protein FRB95_007221 [Tulasnella sp. JGI-2019a]
MTTGKKSVTVRFSSTSTVGQYKLIELPPELIKVVEAKDAKALTKVSIRGRTTDDAVLCTDTRTYSLRSVQMSNSYLVLTGSNKAEDDHGKLILRDQVNEIIELVPVVPKLDRLTALLRGNSYKLDGDNDEDEDTEDDRPRKRRRFSYAQVRGLVQASDKELDRGLRDKHILSVDGHLQSIPASQLTQFLTFILTILVSHHSSKTTDISLKDLTDQLQDDHAIAPDVSRQICGWFGDIQPGDKWTMDVEPVVKEVGLGVLVEHRHRALTESQLLDKWKAAVGDTFESYVKLDLLAGNYVPTIPETISTASSTNPKQYLKYFPASELPTNPSQRFTDLFLTRKSWKLEELAPFLQDIAVDKKERDKLLMKFTRTSTDSDGVVWYNARAKY